MTPQRLTTRSLEKPNPVRAIPEFLQQFPTRELNRGRQLFVGGHPIIDPFVNEVLVLNSDLDQTRRQPALSIPLMIEEMGFILRIERVNQLAKQPTIRSNTSAQNG